MSFDPRKLPKVIIFEEGVNSYLYVHGADLVIAYNGLITKNRYAREHGLATPAQVKAATLVTKEMAKEAVDYVRTRAMSALPPHLITEIINTYSRPEHCPCCGQPVQEAPPR